MRLGPVPCERVRKLRIDHDKTQKEVAEYLHINRRTYSRYELGQYSYPTDILVELAFLYNTSVDYLLELTDELRPSRPSKKRKIK